MKVELIEIDSAVLGRNVLSLKHLNPHDDLADEEVKYIEAFQPGYVSCRVPMEDLATIHLLEQYGFQLIECQIQSSFRFKKKYDVSRFPYKYERVTSPDTLEDVLDIAGKTVIHDRFTVDALVPEGISGERYRRYLQKSFDRSDEEVWRLYDPNSNKTLNFRTHKHIAPGEVLLLIGGVHPDYKNLGLGVVASYFCFNQMKKDGVNKATTNISSINYPIFNLEIAHFGFSVQATFAIMRKIY